MKLYKLFNVTQGFRDRVPIQIQSYLTPMYALVSVLETFKFLFHLNFPFC